MDDLRSDLAAALLGWDLSARIEHAVRVLKNARWAHAANGGYTYPATDKELNVLGIVVAFAALDGTPGVHKFPSGATVRIGEDLGSESAYLVEGQILIEDLPEEIRRSVVRIEPRLQPQRERELIILYGLCQEEQRRYREEES